MQRISHPQSGTRNNTHPDENPITWEKLIADKAKIHLTGTAECSLNPELWTTENAQKFLEQEFEKLDCDPANPGLITNSEVNAGIIANQKEIEAIMHEQKKIIETIENNFTNSIQVPAEKILQDYMKETQKNEVIEKFPKSYTNHLNKKQLDAMQHLLTEKYREISQVGQNIVIGLEAKDKLEATPPFQLNLRQFKQQVIASDDTPPAAQD